LSCDLNKPPNQKKNGKRGGFDTRAAGRGHKMERNTPNNKTSYKTKKRNLMLKVSERVKGVCNNHRTTPPPQKKSSNPKQTKKKRPSNNKKKKTLPKITPNNTHQQNTQHNHPPRPHTNNPQKTLYQHKRPGPKQAPNPKKKKHTPTPRTTKTCRKPQQNTQKREAYQQQVVGGGPSASKSPPPNNLWKKKGSRWPQVVHVRHTDHKPQHGQNKIKLQQNSHPNKGGDPGATPATAKWTVIPTNTTKQHSPPGAKPTRPGVLKKTTQNQNP